MVHTRKQHLNIQITMRIHGNILPMSFSSFSIDVVSVIFITLTWRRQTLLAFSFSEFYKYAIKVIILVIVAKHLIDYFQFMGKKERSIR